MVNVLSVGKIGAVKYSKDDERVDLGVCWTFDRKEFYLYLNQSPIIAAEVEPSVCPPS